MPANGERLSAVARQRRLREARSSQTSTSARSPAPVIKGAEHEDDKRVTLPSSAQVDKAETPPIATANQFTTLVDAAAVHFSSSREVEQVGETALRVRLARGQRCVLVGVSALWVKQGSVSVYGAILHASTALYLIYAPTTHALPSIEALTSTSEFQLDSVNHGIRDLPYIGVRDLWNPTRDTQTSLSFLVVGHSFAPDPKAPKRVREMDLENWKSILATVSVSGPAALPSAKSVCPRVLVCGRRSSGVSTMIRCLINRLLRDRTVSSDKTHHNGVILLDFDTSIPEFAPPGMISIVKVTDPVFGPSFTHVTSTTRSSNSVLKMHFLGDFDGTELTNWHIDRVHDLIALEQKVQSILADVPLIIHAPRWLNGMEQQTMGNIWKKLAPTDIVCMDSRPNSPHLQTWRDFADADNCRIHQISAQLFDKIPSAREHDLQMQSYFHVYAESLMTGQCWTETPVLAGNPVILDYAGNYTAICGIVLLGGHVALEDTYDALEGGLVAILVLERQKDEPATGDDTDKVQVDGNADWVLHQTVEYLPRLVRGSSSSAFPFSAEESRCIGLAMVSKIDVMKRQLALIGSTALGEVGLRSRGPRLALVMQKASLDGRFTTSWARKELRSAGRQRQDPRTMSASEASTSMAG